MDRVEDAEEKKDPGGPVSRVFLAVRRRERARTLSSPPLSRPACRHRARPRHTSRRASMPRQPRCRMPSWRTGTEFRWRLKRLCADQLLEGAAGVFKSPLGIVGHSGADGLEALVQLTVRAKHRVIVVLGQSSGSPHSPSETAQSSRGVLSKSGGPVGVDGRDLLHCTTQVKRLCAVHNKKPRTGENGASSVPLGEQ